MAALTPDEILRAAFTMGRQCAVSPRNLWGTNSITPIDASIRSFIEKECKEWTPDDHTLAEPVIETTKRIAVDRAIEEFKELPCEANALWTRDLIVIEAVHRLDDVFRDLRDIPPHTQHQLFARIDARSQEDAWITPMLRNIVFLRTSGVLGTLDTLAAALE